MNAMRPATALCNARVLTPDGFVEGLAVLMISSDLPEVLGMSDRIMVMKNGVVVEAGSVEEIFHAPKHPYTQLLVSSILQP